jgi:hypothetical protein
METKIIGAQHGAAARNSVHRAAGRCLQTLQQTAAYIAGFAEGLLHSPNA